MKSRYHDAGKYVPHGLLREFVKQMGSAFEHLHNEKQVVHKDVKPANILVRILPPEMPKLKLCNSDNHNSAENPDVTVENGLTVGDTSSRSGPSDVNEPLEDPGEHLTALSTKNTTKSISSSISNANVERKKRTGANTINSSSDHCKYANANGAFVEALNPKKPAFRIQFLLADFGLARTIAHCRGTDGVNRGQEPAGTRLYMPLQIRRAVNGNKVCPEMEERDVWVGIIILLLVLKLCFYIKLDVCPEDCQERYVWVF
jgi:serine/threonine protein kinase